MNAELSKSFSTNLGLDSQVILYIQLFNSLRRLVSNILCICNCLFSICDLTAREQNVLFEDEQSMWEEGGKEMG